LKIKASKSVWFKSVGFVLAVFFLYALLLFTVFAAVITGILPGSVDRIEELSPFVARFDGTLTIIILLVKRKSAIGSKLGNRSF
jgi:hypothetical protein